MHTIKQLGLKLSVYHGTIVGKGQAGQQASSLGLLPNERTWGPPSSSILYSLLAQHADNWS